MNFNKNINLLLVLLLLVSGFTFAQQTISGLVTDEAGSSATRSYCSSRSN